MGDPRKARKKFSGPTHPWQGFRIVDERLIKKNYGLKNKKDIWKVNSELRRIKSQAKELIREKAKGKKQALVEEKQLLDRLIKYGLLAEGSKLDFVLLLEVRDIMRRRLQTLVREQGLSLTPKQARQFIVHGHILVNGRKVTVPSYLVSMKEAATIQFNPGSTLSDPEHPERSKEKKTREEAVGGEVIKERETKAEELAEDELKEIEEKFVVVTEG